MRALLRREDYEAEEARRLAPWAAVSRNSRGRIHPEAEHPYRTAFQRDRDRVVHARAFRRLEYKTQVFIHHEGDHYRNRLTHTLEVAQIARTIARALRVNEDLAEAVALAHDLGHTPFGHAGERVLNELMGDAGGFDHNRQTVRVVDLLERRDASSRGLNLSWETRWGLLKHGAGFAHPLPLPEVTAQPTLEAQIADMADEIAYTNHDLDDGLRSALIHSAQLDELELWATVHGAVRGRSPGAVEDVLRAQTIRALIDRLATDVIEASAERLEALAPESLDALCQLEQRPLGFSADVSPRFAELKRFLRANLYHHPEVVERSRRAGQVLRELWEVYRTRTDELSESAALLLDPDGEARATADYLAGMTDRFALMEHRRLCGGPGHV